MEPQFGVGRGLRFGGPMDGIYETPLPANVTGITKGTISKRGRTAGYSPRSGREKGDGESFYLHCLAPEAQPVPAGNLREQNGEMPSGAATIGSGIGGNPSERQCDAAHAGAILSTLCRSSSFRRPPTKWRKFHEKTGNDAGGCSVCVGSHGLAGQRSISAPRRRRLLLCAQERHPGDQAGGLPRRHWRMRVRPRLDQCVRARLLPLRTLLELRRESKKPSMPSRPPKLGGLFRLERLLISLGPGKAAII